MAKILKRLSYIALSLIAILCFILAFIPFCKKSITVNAEDTTHTVTSIEMVDGASVRLDDLSGLRFSALVNKDYYTNKGADAKWGFLVSQSTTLTTDTFKETTEGVQTVIISSWADDGWGESKKAENPNVKQYNLVLTGIPVANYNTDISVRAFVKVGESYEYSNTFVTRNIAEIANSALNDASAMYDAEELAYVNKYVFGCKLDTDGETVIEHTLDSGSFESGKGLVKTCTECGAKVITDPVNVWTEGEGVVLDRNGMEYKQTKLLSAVPLTFEATVKTPHKLGKTAVIFSNGTDYDKRVGDKTTVEIGINSDGYFNFTLGAGGSNTFSTLATANGDSYYHFAMTFDAANSTVKLYVNGELKETKTGITIDLLPTTREFYFGRNYHSGNANGFDGNGYIMNAAIWSSIRTDEQIATDMEYIPYMDENLLAAYDFNDVVVKDEIIDKTKNCNDLSAHETWFDLDEEELGEYAYSLAVVGDTQSLVDYYPDRVEEVYDWLIAKKDAYKIGYVVNLGDITENKYSYHGNVANEWKIQYNAISKLNGVIPYQLTRGNHDQVDYFNNTFNNDDYNLNVAGKYNGGIETSYSIQYMGNYKYLFLTVNNNPSDEEVAWASDVVVNNADCRVIISTHGYLAYTGELSDSGDSNGTQIWEGLVKKHSNIMFVLCGHIAWDPVLIVSREGVNNNVVTEMLIDPQYMDQNNGASGMVTMFYFTEDGSEVKVRYFSSIRNKVYSIHNSVTIDTSAYASLGLNAADEEAPIITSNNIDDGLVNVRYFVKNAKAYDNKDGAITPTYSVYKDGSDTAITLASNNSFLPDTAGTYILRATATDNAGNTTTKDFEFYIKASEGVGGVIEDFALEGSILNYTGRNDVEWLSSHEGASGVIHLSSSPAIKTEGGYQEFIYRIAKSYQDLDLTGKVIRIKIMASQEISYYNGYGDSDGYGKEEVIVPNTWCYIEVSDFSDIEYFIAMAKSSAGVRLFKYSPAEVDVYIDEISIVEPIVETVGVQNLDDEESVSAIVKNGVNDVILSSRKWLAEYDGATGVVYGKVNSTWYGVHLLFDNTADELSALEWNVLEFKIQRTTSGDICGDYVSSGVSFETDGNWQIYRITKDALINRFGSEEALYRHLTDASERNEYERTFTFYNLTEFYIDYFKLINDTT